MPHTNTTIDALQDSFARWLRHASRESSSDAVLRSRRLGLDDRVKDTLLALRDDHTPLPAELRELLGPLRPPTYDDAARLLLWARHAPGGPRCRSYRSALYLLQCLEATDVEDTSVQRVSAPA